MCKEYYTLPEAARYLAKLSGDEINVADILELALKGKLKLSVDITKTTFAKCYPHGPEEEYTNHPLLGMILNPRSNIFPLEVGIYDLPMKGGEVLDVQYEKQKYFDRSAKKRINTSGTYLEGPDGQMYQLQERFEFQLGDLSKEEISGLFPMSNKVVNGIIDFNRPADGDLKDDSVELDDSDKLSRKVSEEKTNCLPEDGKLEDGSVKTDSSNYLLGHSLAGKTCRTSYDWRPAGCLPGNSKLRVRKSALDKLVKEVAEELEREKQLSKKQEKTVAVEVGIINPGGVDNYKPAAGRINTPLTSQEKPLKRIKSIADYLQVSPSSVKNYMKLKSFPYHKPAGVIEAYPSELDAWQRNRKPKKKK